ncbi:MAG: DUF1830 domain-containing protein [Cyanobium sp. M30B3]|nr:MAG: DUF1830 domain-containing protein [Cyanobium sp. M30B3]
MTTHHYRNALCQMVILRCVGANAFFHEKGIFPFEEWFFACPPDCRVDIWTHGLGGAEILDSICADDLQVPASAKADDPAEAPSLWQTIGVALLESDPVKQLAG